MDSPGNAAQPLPPRTFLDHLGRAQYAARFYADAIESFSKLTAPDHTHHAFLAASSAQLGNRCCGGGSCSGGASAKTGFHGERLSANASLSAAIDTEHVREGLLKAGLPE